MEQVNEGVLTGCCIKTTVLVELYGEGRIFLTHNALLNSLVTVMGRRKMSAISVRNSPMNFTKQWGVLLLVFVFGLAGCAGPGAKPEGGADSQGVVAKKAQSRWDALIKGDLAAAYEYLSPGTRSMVSLEAYKIKIRPGLWKKVDVDSVTCERDRCDVVIMLEYSYRGMKSKVTPLNEIWLQEGGSWWYVPRK